MISVCIVRLHRWCFSFNRTFLNNVKNIFNKNYVKKLLDKEIIENLIQDDKISNINSINE